MKVSELEGALLDYWVAKAENHDILTKEYEIAPGGVYAEWEGGDGARRSLLYSPSTNWAQGGPIIERERIGIEPAGKFWDAYFNASHGYDGMQANPPNATAYDAPTALIAAMRAFVASKYGEEVPNP